jgi:hypothetical protein
MKEITWLPLMALVLHFAACDLQHPGDERHRSADLSDCTECHFHGDGLRPPKGHVEGEEPDSKHEDCLECHARE